VLTTVISLLASTFENSAPFGVGPSAESLN